MKTGTVPSSWIGMTGTMSADRLLVLLVEVEKQAVDPNDLEKISEIWKKVRFHQTNQSKANARRTKLIGWS